MKKTRIWPDGRTYYTDTQDIWPGILSQHLLHVIKATQFDTQKATRTTRQRHRHIILTWPQQGPPDPSVGINASQCWIPLLKIMLKILPNSLQIIISTTKLKSTLRRCKISNYIKVAIWPWIPASYQRCWSSDSTHASLWNKSSEWLDYIYLRNLLNQFEMFVEHWKLSVLEK